MSDNKIFSSLVAGGLAGGLFSYIVVSIFLKMIGEFTTLSFNYLILIGLIIGLFSIIFYKFFIIFNMNIGYYKKVNFQYSAILALVLSSVLYGIYIYNENIYLSFLFLSIIYGICIWIVTILSSSFYKKSKINKMSPIGGGFGGFLGGLLISLIYILIMDFSMDEGYFVLLAFVLCLIGGITGISIVCFFNIFAISKERGFLIFSSRKTIIISGFLIIFALLAITSYAYWDSMNLNKNISGLNDEENIFDCSSLNSMSNVSNNDSKEKLIYFLENRNNKSIDVLGALSLLTGDEKWAKEFKNLLIEDARNNLFVGAGSYRIWQYETTMRADYYNLLSDAHPDLFADSENELILNWFNKINEQGFKIPWDDYIYSFIFKKTPDGLYANQEIGTGMISVLSDVLKDKYPESSRKDKDYIFNHGVGWKGNFRNPDDGIVYHQQIWVKNAYMMAKYGGQEKYLKSINAKNSFEWVLAQWPPNGMSPAYNSPSIYTPFDIMYLGANLFHDGRYLWLANIMLDDEMKNPNRKIDYIIGLEYLNESLSPITPEVRSCYIRGTTGIAQKPAAIKPDKIVLREGWNKDSLYALLNLRFSGWHSYKATNSFISVMYGEPFVVEKLELKNHPWIPKGKADHRDKKIDRTELNGFQIEKTGLQEVIYQITGLGNEWAQDPPRFAEVLAFNSTPIADYSITRISDWHGWDNTRTSVMVKGNDSFIVVFDQNKGKSDGKVAVKWHLKGDAQIGDQTIRLTNKNYSMNVHFPHFEEWYRAEIKDDVYEYPPAGDIHKADYDFNMISENKSEVGFVTLFYPERGNRSYKIQNIDVRNYDNRSMYPDGLGVNIKEQDRTYMISTGNGKDILNYNETDTDARFFIMLKENSSTQIFFKNASIFKIYSDKPPFYIEQNGIKLNKYSDWQYSNGIIIFKTISEEGYVKLKYQD